MPRKAIDYSKCVFYRLVCKDATVNECYVGHTTDEKNRRYAHKTCCTNATNKKYNFFVYKFLRDHGSWDNWELIVHEKMPVKDKQAAKLRERFWLQFYKATLNRQLPGRMKTEYRAAHVEEMKTYNVKYQAAHVEEIKANKAKYRAAHVEEINANKAKYRAAHVEEMKTYNVKYQAAHVEEIKANKAEYRAAHVEEIKATKANYRAAHIDEIKAKQSEKHTCECGGKYTTCGKSQHFKCAKHLAFAAL
jgi:hypothetical protein